MEGIKTEQDLQVLVDSTESEQLRMLDELGETRRVSLRDRLVLKDELERRVRS